MVKTKNKHVFFWSYTSHFLAMVNTFQSGLDRPFIFFCVREWIFCHNFCVGSWKKWCQVWHHLTTLMWRVWCTFTRYYKYIKRSTLDFFPFEFFCNFFFTPNKVLFTHTIYTDYTRIITNSQVISTTIFYSLILTIKSWFAVCVLFSTTSCCIN